MIGNNTEFKIFLGLELEKNASTTLNQEIKKLSKNGVNLKVGLDENSLKTLTTAINGITQQLQKMGTLSKEVGGDVAKGFRESTKATADQLVRLREITQEYKEGKREAKDYASYIKNMIFNKDGGFSKPAQKVPVEELTEYLTLIKQIEGTNPIDPIGDKISSQKLEVLKLGTLELVKQVDTYTDRMGTVQKITSLVGKETGELITSYQTLTEKQEQGKKSLEGQRASLEKYGVTLKDITNASISVINSGKATSEDNKMFAGVNELKKEYQQIMEISRQGQLVDEGRVATFKRMVSELQTLLSIKDKEISKEKTLEEAVFKREKVVKQMQSLLDKETSNYSTGATDSETQEIQKKIDAYAKLNTSKNNMKIKTQELEDAVKCYVDKIKESATAEQKQLVAFEKHANAITKLENAFKNTNNKYQLGVNGDKSNAMEEQINAFKQLDPLSTTYAQDLERVRINLAQYTIETRENTSALSSQMQTVIKLNNLQNSLDNYKNKTDGFYNEGQAGMLQDSINELRTLSLSGEDVSLLFTQLSSKIKQFGADSTAVMRQHKADLKEEQQLYLYKEKMLFNLNTLEQKYAKRGMDTSGITEMKSKVQGLTANTKELTFEQAKLNEAYRQMNSIASGMTLGEKVKNILQFSTGFTGVHDAIQLLRRGIEDIITQVTSLDDAMINLNRVTSETEATYSHFKQSAFQIANEIGGTAEELVNSTTEFAKLGYSFQESVDLATSASKYATVGWLDMAEATNSLSASFSVFGKQMDETIGKTVDATTIIDLYNKIGNTMAVTSGDIGEAMRASANSLAVANNSLSESVALIATANKTIQDSAKVGNALRTISMRIRGVSEDGEELEANLGGLISSITGKYGKAVEIFDKQNQQFKSTYQIMLDLSKVWDDLSDAERAMLGEKIAGKNRVTNCPLYTVMCVQFEVKCR